MKKHRYDTVHAVFYKNKKGGKEQARKQYLERLHELKHIMSCLPQNVDCAMLSDIICKGSLCTSITV